VTIFIITQEQRLHQATNINFVIFCLSRNKIKPQGFNHNTKEDDFLYICFVSKRKIITLNYVLFFINRKKVSLFVFSKRNKSHKQNMTAPQESKLYYYITKLLFFFATERLPIQFFDSFFSISLI
jgi:hypothetical protein